LGFDFGFFNAISLVSWLVALIVLLSSLLRPLENLLLILFPAAGLAILLELFIPDQRLLSESLTVGLRIHILLSICAYSLLMISAVQAIMLAVQEKLIKEKHASIIMNTLPPLQVMEVLLVHHLCDFTLGPLVSGLAWKTNHPLDLRWFHSIITRLLRLKIRP